MPEAKHFAVTEWHSPLTVILSRQAKDPPSHARHFAFTKRHTDTKEILHSLALPQDGVMG